jgi:hypothetical protein
MRRLLAATAAVLTLTGAGITAGPALAAPAAGHQYTFTNRDVGFAEGGTPVTLPGRYPAMQQFLGGQAPIIRIDMEWWFLQPTRETTELNFSRLEPIIRGAHERGFRVLLILGFGVPWLTGGVKGPGGEVIDEGSWFPHEDKPWQDIIGQVMDRFPGMIQAFEVWNEPNNAHNGHYGKSTSEEKVRRYWELVRLAKQTVSARCPSCTVLAGASGHGDKPENWPSAWLEWAYEHKFQDAFDAVALHPYFQAQHGGPSRPECLYRAFNLFGPEDPNCGELAAVRKVMVDNQDGDKKVWATEFGVSTEDKKNPQNFKPLPVIRDYIVEGVDMWRKRSYTGPMFLYSFQDTHIDMTRQHPWPCEKDPGDDQCHYGLTDNTGRPKEPLFTDVSRKLTESWPAYLPHGKSLRRWATMRSQNGRFELRLQQDGNLVLYRLSDMHPLWNTNTRDGVTLDVQPDGNLVLYTATGAVARNVGTAKPRDLPSNTGRPVAEHPVASTLWVQEDGNLVLYRERPKDGPIAVWASETGQT